MNEIIANLHIHTRYSDGSRTHSEVAEQAIAAGLDVLITTDHNVLVKGMDRYISIGKKRVLLLTGEEVHDQDRIPQKNHMLVLGAGEELATKAYDPQELIDSAARLGGLTFLAHPNDKALSLFHETDISWVNWDVSGFTGLEIWNHFSQFKDRVNSLPSAIRYAYNPELIATEPDPFTLKKWDELLSHGKRISAVGGSDAHELHFQKGFIKKLIFPYRFHFNCINTHLFISEPLSGEVEHDRHLVYQALRTGSSFVGYDLAAPTKGFSFSAQNEDTTVSIGQSINLHHGVTLHVKTPRPIDCRLIFNGKVVATWLDADRMIYTATEPGAYRVECRREFLGEKRGWIFSNPIYVQSPNPAGRNQ